MVARRPSADADAEAAGQARRDRRSQRPRAGLQRRRRHDRRRPVGNRRSGRASRARSAPRSTGCTADRRADMAKKPATQAAPSSISSVRCRRRRRARFAALQLPGITFLKESRRYYPKRELAAHVLGYVGLDNVGLGGIESAYDAQIRGRDGKVLIQTDARRHALSSRVERPATAGAEHRAHDRSVPAVRRRARAAHRRRGEPRRRRQRDHHGSAHRRDPGAGQLADVQSRTRSREPTTTTGATGRFRTLYEPGSTFKIVTASAALEQHVITPETLIETSPGFITFGPRIIHDTHIYGLIPFTDVIVKSSNVGAIKVGHAGRRADAGAVHRPLRLRPDAGAGLPRRDRGHRVELRRSSTRARSRRCRWATRSASRHCRW